MIALLQSVCFGAWCWLSRSVSVTLPSSLDLRGRSYLAWKSASSHFSSSSSSSPSGCDCRSNDLLDATNMDVPLTPSSDFVRKVRFSRCCPTRSLVQSNQRTKHVPTPWIPLSFSLRTHGSSKTSHFSSYVYLNRYPTFPSSVNSSSSHAFARLLSTCGLELLLLQNSANPFRYSISTGLKRSKTPPTFSAALLLLTTRFRTLLVAFLPSLSIPIS